MIKSASTRVGIRVDKSSAVRNVNVRTTPFREGSGLNSNINTSSSKRIGYIKRD